MTEMMVTTGAIRRAKLQSHRHQKQTKTQFFLQAGCPSCHPTNSVRALKEKDVDYRNINRSCPTSPCGSRRTQHTNLVHVH